jgi:ADP-ribose pyrophosphatase YjhB (NUDIX family)
VLKILSAYCFTYSTQHQSREYSLYVPHWCVALILDKERRVLLYHRRYLNLWNLPGGGGRVRALEAPWEGVVREVKEEVGLTVKPKRIIPFAELPETENISLRQHGHIEGFFQHPEETVWHKHQPLFVIFGGPVIPTSLV